MPDPHTDVVPRSDIEQRADRICDALESLGRGGSALDQLIWEYFRDGKDDFALKLLQTYQLYRIAGSLEEIQMMRKFK